jgi:hypothetical protein
MSVDISGCSTEIYVRRDHSSTLRRRDEAEDGSLLDTLGHRGKLESALGVLQTIISSQYDEQRRGRIGLPTQSRRLLLPKRVKPVP